MYIVEEALDMVFVDFGAEYADSDDLRNIADAVFEQGRPFHLVKCSLQWDKPPHNREPLLFFGEEVNLVQSR